MTSTIDQLQQQLETLTSSIATIKSNIDSIQDQLNKELACEDFDSFVQNEIAPYFGESTAENIVKVFRQCRIDKNFQNIVPVYQWKSIHGNLEKRQLLKLISAVYRIKFYPKHSSNVSSLKSDVKYAKACPECGKLASAFYLRLVKEGLM